MFAPHRPSGAAVAPAPAPPPAAAALVAGSPSSRSRSGGGAAPGLPLTPDQSNLIGAMAKTVSSHWWFIVVWLLMLTLACGLSAINISDATACGSGVSKTAFVVTWSEQYCCPAGGYELEANPRGDGLPRCTRCRLDHYACDDGDGCCGQDDFCVRDSSGNPACSPSSSGSYNLSSRARSDARLDRSPSDRSLPWPRGFVLGLTICIMVAAAGLLLQFVAMIYNWICVLLYGYSVAAEAEQKEAAAAARRAGAAEARANLAPRPRDQLFAYAPPAVPAPQNNAAPELDRFNLNQEPSARATVVTSVVPERMQQVTRVESTPLQEV